jgi:hypothetical protein
MANSGFVKPRLPNKLPNRVIKVEKNVVADTAAGVMLPYRKNATFGMLAVKSANVATELIDAVTANNFFITTILLF